MSTMVADLGSTRPFAPQQALAVGESVAGDRAERLSRGQVVVVALSIGLGLTVGGYGLVGSYITVSELAARRGVPLASLVPAGIDGGLVAVVVLDLVVTWVGVPVGWLRQLVRVLSVGTVVANVIGGWPDPVAVGLHTAAPVMVLAMVEAGRTVLLRRMGEARGVARDVIPWARWVLAPWRTCLLWRRMILWQIASYRTAVDTELELCRAVAVLRVRYGRRWRRHTPADLVWMLRTGVGVEEACARVRASVGADRADVAATPIASAPVCDCDDSASRRPVRPAEPVASQGAHDTELGLIAGEVDQDRFAEAVRLNREHWVRTGRPISAATLRKRLRLGAAKSRSWCRAIRAEDRAAVCGTA